MGYSTPPALARQSPPPTRCQPTSFPPLPSPAFPTPVSTDVASAHGAQSHIQLPGTARAAAVHGSLTTQRLAEARQMARPPSVGLAGRVVEEMCTAGSQS